MHSRSRLSYIARLLALTIITQADVLFLPHLCYLGQISLAPAPVLPISKAEKKAERHERFMQSMCR